MEILTFSAYFFFFRKMRCCVGKFGWCCCCTNSLISPKLRWARAPFFWRAANTQNHSVSIHTHTQGMPLKHTDLRHFSHSPSPAGTCSTAKPSFPKLNAHSTTHTHLLTEACQAVASLPIPILINSPYCPVEIAASSTTLHHRSLFTFRFCVPCSFLLLVVLLLNTI